MTANEDENNIPVQVRMIYRKGQDALLRENYDYAIELFTMALAKEPNFSECRKALQIAQARKSGGK